MQRRDFILTSLLSFPAFACSTSKRTGGVAAKAFVVRAGDSRFHQPTPFNGVNPNDLKVSTKDTGGRLSTFYYHGVEKVGPGLHSHLHQDEMFFVLEGEYVFQLGEERQLLQAGDLIFLPRTVPHTWVQMSDRGKMFYFLQPAGKMEEFFLKLTELDGKGTREQYEELGKMSGIANHGPAISATEKHVFVEKLSNGFVVRAGQGRYVERTVINGKNPNDIKVSGKDTGGELSVFEYFGNEKGGPPMHVHPHQDEVFYVSEGSYLFQCGDEKFTLGEGDMIFLPRAVPHTWAQLEDKGRLLFFFQPAGKMEDFFRSIGGNKTLAAGLDPFKEHDMEVVGPPISF
jgi:quercetin dioxygenase-like cupin family protein